MVKVTEKSQRIRIRLKAYDHKVIDQSAKQIVETATRSGASVSGPVPLPVKISKWIVQTCTFVDKDARDQYQMKTHKRLIDIFDPTPQTIDALMHLSLPAGVGIEIKM